MKTKLFHIVFIGFLLLTLSNCSKNNPINEPEPELKSGQITYGLDVSLDSNTQNLSSLISGIVDTSERRLDYYTYYLAESLQELFEIQSFNEYVVNLALQSESKTADLRVIYNASLAYKAIIDDELDNFNITFDEIVDHFTYNDSVIHECYIPAIYVPNADTADINKQPIFSPNIEADCSGNEDLEDCIIAWYFDNTVRKEVVLSEENSLLTSNPIFLLDNAEIPTGNEKSSPVIFPPSENLFKSSDGVIQYWSSEYMINKHYEPTGKSEYCIISVRIAPDGHTEWIHGTRLWLLIRQVPRDQMGVHWGGWVMHSPNYTPYNTNYVYWNTFERDWNRSQKSLGQVLENNTTITLWGERHFNHEWYMLEPLDLQDDNTDFPYINYHTFKV